MGVKINYASFVINLILKVVRSSRLRGYLTPSSIYILSNMVSSGHLGSEEVFFVGTNHGKRMMLAQCSHLINEIYLLVLTPANFNKNQSEEADRNFLNDLYHWELVINHLSQHSSIIPDQTGDMKILFRRLVSSLPEKFQLQIEKLWDSRVQPAVEYLAKEDVNRNEKKQYFNSNFSAFSKVTEAFMSRVRILKILAITFS